MLKLLLKAELPLLVVAGIVGQALAKKAWTAVAGGPVPDTAQRHVSVAQLVPVAVVEGTLYKLTRMALDRALRNAIANREGTWVGSAGDGE